MNKMAGIFQDWAANRRNPKGRFIMVLFRLANACASLPRPLIWASYVYLIFYRLVVEWLLGVEIPWKTEIGPELRLYHGVGLVVHDRTKIGRGCVLRHSTTIGVAKTSNDFGGTAPVLEDFVDVGANSVIIGPIRLGAGTIVGAGAVVVKDVDVGCVVVGNPAKILSPKNAG